MYSKKKIPFSDYFFYITVVCDYFSINKLGSRFYSWINDKITHTGWELKVGESSGSMFGTSYLDNVTFSILMDQ